MKKVVSALLGVFVLFVFVPRAGAWKNGNFGNIIVAGSLYNGSSNDFFVIKYDANGNELWRYLLNGALNSGDGANDIAIDSAGNVIAVGTLTNGAWQLNRESQGYLDYDFT